jgi:hypothetical protein
MPYRRIEREDGSSYTAWEPGAAGATHAPGADPHGRITYGDDGELIVMPPEAPTPPESESVINERIRAQSGGVNGCITFGCLFTLMLLAIFLCGAVYLASFT